MPSLPRDIRELVAAEKTLGVFPLWDDADRRYFKQLIPLTVGEVTIGGFELRLHVSKRHIARDAVAQLEFSTAGRRSAIGLWRMCWRPFSTHQNDGVPPDLPFEIYDGSHEHPFNDNYLEEEIRMRSGNLPAARGLDPDPGSLSDFLALCGERFRIKDINRLKLPVTTPGLFW